MEKTKILKTLLATLMLIVLLGTMCFAAGIPITSNTQTGKITVNKVEAGATVKLYKLLSVNLDSNGKPLDPAYVWDSSVENWMKTDETKYSTYANPEVFYNTLKGDATATEAFYSSLVAEMKSSDSSINLTAKYTKTAEGTLSYAEVAEKTVEFTECEMGLYLILIEDGFMVYAPATTALIPESVDGAWTLNDQVVNVKSTPVQITKVVDRKNHATNENVGYTITADVPNYVQNTTAKTLYISDVLDAGLTFNNDNTFHVYGVNGSGEVELKNTADTTYYTLIPTGAKTDKAGTADASFAVEFNYDKVAGFEKVKVVYTAKLNKDTSLVLGTAGNGNTANLVYNNNPYVETAYKTQTTTEVNVYTYGVNVTKVDKTTNAKLPGAEFELKKGTSVLYFVGSNGVYYLASEGDTGATTTLAVNAQGELKINGLDVGDYVLTETKAPNEYVLSTKSEPITIKDDNLDGNLNDSTDNTGIYSVTFKNSKGFSLPVTGGTGTVIFAVAGIILIALGAVIIVSVKKNNANK